MQQTCCSTRQHAPPTDRKSKCSSFTADLQIVWFLTKLFNSRQAFFSFEENKQATTVSILILLMYNGAMMKCNSSTVAVFA